MKPKSIQKKREKKYTLKEIKRAISLCYDRNGHQDDWGVQVIYKSYLLQKIGYLLK